MTEGKLVFLPKGYRVVPEYPTDEMVDTYNCSSSYKGITESYQDMISKAPQLTTPPVLRWKDNHLVLFGKKYIAYVHKKYGESVWVNSLERIYYRTEQEARRAAEKALGFPDGLVVEVV